MNQHAPSPMKPLALVEALMQDAAGGDLLGSVASQALSSGGKRTRAQLALAAGEALGVWTVPWAAACELLHNATLVHDDLQDGDRTRRGKPTVWAEHGPAQAINAGDLMLMLPTLVLGGLPVEHRWPMAELLHSGAVACVRGQALELSLPTLAHPSRQDWDAAVRGKSGELLALPVQGACLLAGRDDASSVGQVFRELGVLYQLADDLTDLYGDKGRGERGCDLREGKISALVVAHLAERPEDTPWLRAVLAAPRDETPDIDLAARRFVESGAVARIEKDIQRLARLPRGLPPELRPIGQALVQKVMA